ncbi:MAG TPA: hypothetical protein VD931_06515, partial [Baekduia sp.]|nr:hypothetical protein [Baekduia sp.]
APPVAPPAAPAPPPAPAPAPRERAEPPPLVDQPTRGFSADDVAEAIGDPAPDPDLVPADDAEAHDELEETPDFLQETPEHDRLWFEQKPPKDFDF